MVFEKLFAMLNSRKKYFFAFLKGTYPLQIAAIHQRKIVL